MRPTPIPDDEVWEGAYRLVITAPDGDLTGDIRPVEAVRSLEIGGPCISLRIGLDDGDLARLADHGVFWLTIHARQLPPFSLHVPEAGVRPPAIIRTDADTIQALLGERSGLMAENATLRRENAHLSRMLNPPPEPPRA